MKRNALVVIVVMCSLLAPAQRKTVEDDPHWREHTVQNAFDEVSVGMYYSWTEKWLARMGDGAAPEVMKCLSAKPLTKQNIETALTLVKMSFGFPRLIRHDQDRTPTNTLAFLDYLDKQSSDADVRLKIDSVRDELRARPPAMEPKKNSNN